MLYEPSAQRVLRGDGFGNSKGRGHDLRRAPLCFNNQRDLYAAVLPSSQQGRVPFLQQAAPLLQHDASVVGLTLLIIGHLPPQQPALPFLWAAISHLPSLQHPLSLPQHDFPLAILPSLVAAMSHLPSLQQPSPQQDLPSAILPSFIMGHFS